MPWDGDDFDRQLYLNNFYAGLPVAYAGAAIGIFPVKVLRPSERPRPDQSRRCTDAERDRIERQHGQARSFPEETDDRAEKDNCSDGEGYSGQWEDLAEMLGFSSESDRQRSTVGEPDKSGNAQIDDEEGIFRDGVELLYCFRYHLHGQHNAPSAGATRYSRPPRSTQPARCARSTSLAPSQAIPKLRGTSRVAPAEAKTQRRAR